MATTQPTAKTLSVAFVPLFLVASIALVVGWEVLANRSRRPFSPFNMTSADFATFAPKAAGWSLLPADVQANDPTAPNLLAFRVEREQSRDQDRGVVVATLVRMAHGYNMPDCMRLKGYKVELLREVAAREMSGVAGVDEQAETALPRVQVWRLTSDVGDVSIWCSAMLRASDFGGSTEDIRNMAFPRIAEPISPEWEWEGFKLSSLRHPLKSLEMAVRVKWNNSRCDLLTFLKLRQPAWASSDYLTFLATSRGVVVRPGDESRVTDELLAAQSVFHAELLQWAEKRGKSVERRK
ncbi:MAG: hypothetical protein WCL44_09670 [bacterium]